jgi:hypothetical protein
LPPRREKQIWQQRRQAEIAADVEQRTPDFSAGNRGLIFNSFLIHIIAVPVKEVQ